jgi:hypothetical protein
MRRRLSQSRGAADAKGSDLERMVAEARRRGVMLGDVILDQLGLDVPVTNGATPVLIATIDGLHGRVELR